jgi:hypothetical protein
MSSLLTESGSALLLESGSALLLEQGVGGLLLESGATLLLESGSALLVEAPMPSTGPGASSFPLAFRLPEPTTWPSSAGSSACPRERSRVASHRGCGPSQREGSCLDD